MESNRCVQIEGHDVGHRQRALLSYQHWLRQVKIVPCVENMYRCGQIDHWCHHTSTATCICVVTNKIHDVPFESLSVLRCVFDCRKTHCCQSSSDSHSIVNLQQRSWVLYTRLYVVAIAYQPVLLWANIIGSTNRAKSKQWWAVCLYGTLLYGSKMYSRSSG